MNMICKEDLIKLGFESKQEYGHCYLEYPLDLDLKLTSYVDPTEDYPLNVELEPTGKSICFTEEKDVKAFIRLIENARI